MQHCWVLHVQAHNSQHFLSFCEGQRQCSATLLDPKTIAFSQANNVGSYCVCLHIAIMYITTISSTVHVLVCTLTINNIITMDLK